MEPLIFLFKILGPTYSAANVIALCVVVFSLVKIVGITGFRPRPICNGSDEARIIIKLQSRAHFTTYIAILLGVIGTYSGTCQGLATLQENAGSIEGLNAGLAPFLGAIMFSAVTSIVPMIISWFNTVFLVGWTRLFLVEEPQARI